MKILNETLSRGWKFITASSSVLSVFVKVILFFLLIIPWAFGFYGFKSKAEAVEGVKSEAIYKSPQSQGNLFLIAKDLASPGLSVYVYRFHDGHGGYYHFVIAERNFKDGVSVSQLK
jgi:hypothetical protein